jgi:hypothetical protein
VILGSIGPALPEGQRDLFVKQLAHINKVQRLLDWNEIEFYCMSWFKVRWPDSVLFEDHGELELGGGTLRADGAEVQVRVWAVNGHVFSIESDMPLKPFRSATDVSFSLASAVQPPAAVDGFAAH